ncbi:MAG: SpoIIE family protein phosphatase [Phycisphaerales bacterium]|nr:SpoIIE family protein phosphatase [Phycisphaerales bacterium]
MTQNPLSATSMPTSADLAPDACVVLLVDDQMIIGEAVRRILAGVGASQAGIRFHFCQKGQEAVATAAKLQPTVILQDLVMPDADGLELVKAYREHVATQQTPIVVLSSKEEGTTKAEAFARGANDYIVKLPDPVELVARIRYHSQGYLSLLQRNQAFLALRESQAALAHELHKAAEYVRSLLPEPMRQPLHIDWKFVPSASLGGDCFDYFVIDEDHVAMYVLDVCGHGVGPALLGVSAMNSIRTSSHGGADVRDPSSVLSRLNAMFPMGTHGGMFFTIWYGVFQRSTRTLRYSGGGHPPAMLVRRGEGTGGGNAIQELECPGPPIGVVPDIDFETLKVDVPREAALFIYSDGAFEVFPEPGKLWGVEGINGFIASHDLSDAACLDALYAEVKSMTPGDVLADDFSAVLARLG